MKVTLEFNPEDPHELMAAKRIVHSNQTALLYWEIQNRVSCIEDIEKAVEASGLPESGELIK